MMRARERKGERETPTHHEDIILSGEGEKKNENEMKHKSETGVNSNGCICWRCTKQQNDNHKRYLSQEERREKNNDYLKEDDDPHELTFLLLFFFSSLSVLQISVFSEMMSTKGIMNL